MDAIKILLADDHPVIRNAIERVIERESDMTVIGVAANGLEAYQQHEQLSPDVTLMDIAMPIMDGIEAIERIRENAPDARIIVLTNFDTDEDIKRGLASGAMGYLLKDSSPDHLLDTIRKVRAGDIVVPQHLLEKIERNQAMPHLSPREIDVLQLMMRGKSNRAIGVELGITESTVKSHVKNILIKMSVNDRTQAVTAALRRGILQMGE